MEEFGWMLDGIRPSRDHEADTRTMEAKLRKWVCEINTGSCFNLQKIARTILELFCGSRPSLSLAGGTTLIPAWLKNRDTETPFMGQVTLGLRVEGTGKYVIEREYWGRRRWREDRRQFESPIDCVVRSEK
ncbi:hypothetical protein H6P81_018302 [Aristolochia fimbriata]|uniref:Uncharacterized protein n=1 Tax=Aristolochia fimbriata TaxID=158543 RepID=A0AAV7E107_ARIFI|nr:hypothetical protein H6P81_018302 [Aristolochia fimbriata]